LEAGGVIGFIGVFLALTQAAWAPDMFSGLIILNSKMVEVGDVIELNEGDNSLGVVYKTKVFHTELLNLINNHRIMIKNSKLREYTIHNLSKFASAKGLRERISFNIDYAVSEQKVRELFNTAYDRVMNDTKIAIEPHPLEIGVNNTGDYAVEWCVYYYTKDVKNIMKTRQQFREVTLTLSKEMGISLATPSLHVVEH
jgi:small-conductance mechanosensitive channel